MNTMSATNIANMSMVSAMVSALNIVGGKDFKNHEATRKKNRAKNKQAKKSRQQNRKK